MRVSHVVVILCATTVIAAALSLVVRRLLAPRPDFNVAPWTQTLSYVATSYGVVLGFSIIFLFGEFSDARNAIGNEATSIGTAFDEAQLFPESQTEIQHSLICYSRAVPEFDWPALQNGGSSPVVDEAYSDIFVTLSEVTESTDGTFQPATATNLVLQLGSVSTARETRLVAAEIQTPPMLSALLLFGAVLVLGLLFVVTLPEGPIAQATLVGLGGVFTAFMLLIVVALSSPFSEGTGRLSPELIEQTTASMIENAPEAAAIPCSFDTQP